MLRACGLCLCDFVFWFCCCLGLIVCSRVIVSYLLLGDSIVLFVCVMLEWFGVMWLVCLRLDLCFVSLELFSFGVLVVSFGFPLVVDLVWNLLYGLLTFMISLFSLNVNIICCEIVFVISDALCLGFDFMFDGG